MIASRLIWEPAANILDMASAKIPGGPGYYSPVPAAVINPLDTDWWEEPRALMVFSDWKHGNVDISFWAGTPRWATRGILEEIADFVFVRRGCRRLQALVEVGNARCIKLLFGLGFQWEGELRCASSTGGDMVVTAMLRETCRWLR